MSRLTISTYCSVYIIYSVYASHVLVFFFFQAEDGIRDLVRSRGLGDVYKRQVLNAPNMALVTVGESWLLAPRISIHRCLASMTTACLLYTSDAADERSSVDLGGRRIIKKKKSHNTISV